MHPNRKDTITLSGRLSALCEKWEQDADMLTREGRSGDATMADCAYELRAIIPDVERLVGAAQMHAKKGHNDTCSLALCGDHYQCDCGYAIAVAALALFDQPVAPKETRAALDAGESRKEGQ